MIHKPSLESLDVPQKIWARSVQPFWIQTDKPNLYIDNLSKMSLRMAGELCIYILGISEVGELCMYILGISEDGDLCMYILGISEEVYLRM